MSRKIKRQIFLDELPKKGKSIDWKESAKKKCTVNFIYDDIEGVITIVDFIVKNKNSFVKVKYNNNEIIVVTNQIKDCAIGKLLNKHNGDFKVEIGTIFKDEKRDIVITDTKIKVDNKGIRRKYYKYKCYKCGYDEGYIEESHLLGKHKGGCSACCKYGSTPVLGINTIYDTDPWMIPIIGEEVAKMYTHSSDFKVFPICPDCGKTKEKKMALKTIYANHSMSCLSCGDGKSYCEKFAFKMLEELKIDFISEYSPDWIGKRRYDFYFELSNNKYIIEMDGRFHTEYNELSEQSVKESKNIDKYKDDMAIEHNIEVIRIDCNYHNMDLRFEYIKQNIITNEKLNKLFDLSNIDWLKCNEYAISNLMNVVYGLWNNGKNINEIKVETKLSDSCIRSYLKRGAVQGICNYKIKKIKRVSVYKDDKYIDTYNNVDFLFNNSIKLFGIKFNKSNMYKSCKTGIPYKGYVFELIEDLD